jgi:hypothetical protein
MQTAIVFDRVAVSVRHWFEISPEDAEHGARIEMRAVERVPHQGSESAAQPFGFGLPIWRADLFDLIGPPPGNMRRAHFHTKFDGCEPIGREWDDDLTAKPFGWLAAQLRDLSPLLLRFGFAPDVAQATARDVARSATEICRLAGNNSGTACRGNEDCLAATRDVAAVVAMMLAAFRPGSPDPRLTETTRRTRGSQA